jgi:hypothetical protein
MFPPDAHRTTDFCLLQSLRSPNAVASSKLFLLEILVQHESLCFNMASTLENRDHFKDVSNDGARQTRPFIQDQSRQNRLSSLDHVSPLTFGSSFGVGKSMWNSTSNIWRSTAKFMDGPSDEGMARDTLQPNTWLCWLIKAQNLKLMDKTTH